MKFNLLVNLIWVIPALMGGCYENSGDSLKTSGSPLESNSSPAVDQFAQNLSKRDLHRHPDRPGPSTLEAQLLTLQDHRLFSLIYATDRYQTTLGRVLSSADISALVTVFVHDDFRLAQLPFGGGMAGHDYFILDGKFLDILADYANFRALRKAGLTAESQASAIDSIVNWHNASALGRSIELYPYTELPHAQKVESDRMLDAYIGAITFHEFGHYYSYHLLDHLRSLGTFGKRFVHYDANHEDAADRLAGALMRKAGLDLSLGQETLDLLAFYSLNRHGQVFSMFEVAASLPTQFNLDSIRYSSLLVRKELMAEGYLRYADYLKVAQQ